MKRWNLLVVVPVALLSLALSGAPVSTEQNWTNYVRIGAYGLRGGDAAEIVRKAQASDVAGIEVDNDI